MNAFYETELKGDEESMETNRSFAYDETDSLATGLTSHRRDIKKPTKDKEKQKLWESIVTQAEQEADGEGSSSDENERI